MIVIGSAISLAYYLRVVVGGVDARAGRADARAWSRRAAPRPAIAGGSPEADADPEASAAGARLAARWSSRPTSAAGRSPRSSGSAWCAPRRRCSSGSTRARCSTSRTTRARLHEPVLSRRGGEASRRGARPTPRSCPIRRRAGQAAAEYVAVLLVVGAVAGRRARRPSSAVPGVGGAVVARRAHRAVHRRRRRVPQRRRRGGRARAVRDRASGRRARTRRSTSRSCGSAATASGSSRCGPTAARSSRGSRRPRSAARSASARTFSPLGVDGRRAPPLVGRLPRRQGVAVRRRRARRRAFLDGAMHDAARAGRAARRTSAGTRSSGGAARRGRGRGRRARGRGADDRREQRDRAAARGRAAHAHARPRARRARSSRGAPARLPAPGRRPPARVVADVTWEAGAAARAGAAHRGRARRPARGVDRARSTCASPASRALAERLLRPGGGTADDLRAVADHAAAHGVVERSAYATTERRRGVSLAARLGARRSGSRTSASTAERRLDGRGRLDPGRPAAAQARLPRRVTSRTLRRIS